MTNTSGQLKVGDKVRFKKEYQEKVKINEKMNPTEIGEVVFIEQLPFIMGSHPLLHVEFSKDHILKGYKSFHYEIAKE